MDPVADTEPYTPHPTPYTLHSTPYTLHPTPYTLHPTPCTLLPTPDTLHPKPSTLNQETAPEAGPSGAEKSTFQKLPGSIGADPVAFALTGLQVLIPAHGLSRLIKKMRPAAMSTKRGSGIGGAPGTRDRTLKPVIGRGAHAHGPAGPHSIRQENWTKNFLAMKFTARILQHHQSKTCCVVNFIARKFLVQFSCRIKRGPAGP